MNEQQEEKEKLVTEPEVDPEGVYQDWRKQLMERFMRRE